ncbi:hypothetical protein ACFYXF_30025 [Streptomyces sp. NPDC002680]|uniref:hypothetical protein n=1 Tax=Streptomyces sp. NPDC002680 TaxID=3364659 RepID=UPI00367F0EE7
MTDPQVYRTAALVVSCALRDDDTSARLLLHTLPPPLVVATCEASIFAMAELLRDHVPAHAIQAAIHGAQQLAHQAAEGNTP